MTKWQRTKAGRFEWRRGDDDLLVVADLSLLFDAERAEVPTRIVRTHGRWLAASAARFEHDLPTELSWLRARLLGCQPMIERWTFDRDRVSWHVRIVPDGARSLRRAGTDLLRRCPAADGVVHSDHPAELPTPLDWLATMFGTTRGELQTSGTSPWGRPLGAIIDAGDALVSDPATAARLPPGSRDWVALYEVDGDVLVADLANGGAHWAGHEWTGHAHTDFALSWRAVVPFLVFCQFEGLRVRPSDLEMLAACHAAR
jgi:hypothetical protein